MPEETLATVAEDLNQIQAEPGVNALGESYEETQLESDDFVAALQEILDQEGYELQIVAATEAETEELSTISLEEDFLAVPILDEIRAASDPQAARAVMPALPTSKAYKLDLDGYQYYAWFPAGAELVVTDEGYIYNESSSNISGVIAASADGVSLGGYNDFVTIAPLLSTGSNNNAYRYGSRVYITDYYAGVNGLSSTVNYISSAKAIDKPGAGYGFSRYQLLTVGFFLILVLVLLIRGRKSL